MGLLSFVRNRKAVVASRATTSGIPNNWDTPYSHPAGPSNKQLMDRKKPQMPKGNYESVNSQGSSSSLKPNNPPDTHQYRLTSYGDD